MRSLQAHSVSVLYGLGANKSLAVDQVDAVFLEKQFTAICGPSGSGKTSLLLVLGLLRTPDFGHVEINSTAASCFDESERSQFRRNHLGFIFQSHRLMASLTAVENVQLALDLQGVGRAEQRSRANDCLVRLKMGHKAHLKPGELSGGERQRVAIARAVVHRPQVVLADEPTASLDSSNAEAVGHLLREIAHEGTTVVAVTHDAALARLADRAIHMRDGRIIDAL